MPSRDLLSSVSAAAAAAADPYSQYNTLLLSGDGTNGSQNNTFVDSSTNNFTITRNGNTTQGSFSPYGSLWSNYFDNDNDYLTVPASSNLNFGTGDFTVEGWIKIEGGIGYNVIVAPDSGSYSSSGWWWLITDTTTGELLWQCPYPTQPAVNTTNVCDGKWHHFAAVRSGTSAQLFIDGVSGGTSTSTQSFGMAGVGYRIGQWQTNYPMYGNISNLRFVKGSAVYTSNFTPSTEPLTAISGTQLLTCQSNRFIDNSSNNFSITPTGDVSVQRFSPFDPSASYATSTIGGSGYFDGTGDYLTMPNNAAFDLSGTGSWTVSASVYFSTLTTYAAVLSLENASGGSPNWVYFKDADGYMELHLNGGGRFINNNTAIKAGQWYDFTLTYDGSNIRHYINGVLDSTVACGSINSYTIAPEIGGRSSSNYLNGYIGGVRIVKGHVNAPSGVSTSPYTAVTGTTFLANFQNASIIDNAMMNDLETVGNAQISTSVKKYGTGSMYFDASSNCKVRAPYTPMQNFGTGDFTVEGWFYALDTGYRPLITCYSSGGNRSWIVILGSGSWEVSIYGGGTYQSVYSGATPSTNAWHHFALVRSGSNYLFYVDGSQLASTAVTYDPQDSTSPVVVGSYGDGYASYIMNGYIDDLRITKGYARYTANFTPPTAALPTY